MMMSGADHQDVSGGVDENRLLQQRIRQLEYTLNECQPSRKKNFAVQKSYSSQTSFMFTLCYLKQIMNHIYINIECIYGYGI